MTKAVDIANNLLCKTGKAMSQGSQSEFLDAFDIPNFVETLEGKREILAAEEVAATFGRLRWYYRRFRIDRVDRFCEAAFFLNHSIIVSRHQTIVRKNGYLILHSYPTVSTLVLRNGQWKVGGGSYAIVGADEHVRALLGSRMYKV